MVLVCKISMDLPKCVCWCANNGSTEQGTKPRVPSRITCNFTIFRVAKATIKTMWEAMKGWYMY